MSNGILSMAVDSDEKLVASLGSRWIDNLVVTGKFSKDVCVVTDKRIYFRGKNIKSGKIGKEEAIVDLKDVTGTSFSVRQYLIWWLLAVVCIGVYVPFCISENEPGLAWLAIIPAILFPSCYFLTKKRCFHIFFAGGAIVFKANRYSMNDIKKFHLNLRRAIDNLYLDSNHKVEIEVVNAEEEVRQQRPSMSQRMNRSMNQNMNRNMNRSMNQNMNRNINRNMNGNMNPQMGFQAGQQMNYQSYTANAAGSGYQNGWTCVQCGTVNAEASDFCVGCGTHR